MLPSGRRRDVAYRVTRHLAARPLLLLAASVLRRCTACQLAPKRGAGLQRCAVIVIPLPPVLPASQGAEGTAMADPCPVRGSAAPPGPCCGT